MQNTKKIVLVTEDEAPMLRILIDALSECGFETMQARDGQAGLQLALQKHPDLVLIDILMPKMDGLTMMRKLRKDSWGKKVPIIILTNVSSDTDPVIQAIVENQPSYYFVKSDVKLDDIVEKIKKVLSSQN
jgi:DNA-binding response OmpR family regulator